MKKSIAVAKGDGIGSEIMDAVLEVFNTVGVPIDYHFVDMGKDIFLQGHKLGMTPDAKNIIEKHGVLFKGPMETPKGGGNRSINVVSRKMWSTYANCRVFKFLPGVETIFSKAGVPVDITIIRENIEDTYGGVEHLITPDVAVGRRFISAPGSYQIHKYAFEYAKQQGIDTVTCGHKANIMKLTDGMFLEIFYEVAKEYPEIKANDVIVDDLCMKLVTAPQTFKVVVLPNLQGDIVSDLCAGLVGGLGFAPSANIGSNIAIFEAVHGTAPDIAGKGLANPTALLLSGLMMLNFLGFTKEAKKIEIAIHETLKSKIHTADLKSGATPVSTKDYAKAVAKKALEITDSHPLMQSIKNTALTLAGDDSKDLPLMMVKNKIKSTLKGLDLFVQTEDKPNIVGQKINALNLEKKGFKLEVIANRGTNVYPESSIYTENVNSYTLRLLTINSITEKNILEIASIIADVYSILSIEMLRDFDGKIGYSSI
jgi:isocitrate dehydrogenase